MTSFQQWSSNTSFDAMAASDLDPMSGGLRISDATIGRKSMLCDASGRTAVAVGRTQGGPRFLLALPVLELLHHTRRTRARGRTVVTPCAAMLPIRNGAAPRGQQPAHVVLHERRRSARG